VAARQPTLDQGIAAGRRTAEFVSVLGRRPAQWTIACALFALGVGLAVSNGAAFSASTGAGGRSLGISIPWSSTWLSQLDAVSQQIGAAPAIVGSYRDWTIPLVNGAQLDGVISRGAVPQVTWEPWDASGSPSDPSYALSTITDGSHDAYIQASAQAAAGYGKPFQLRFAPEMNGNWAPWEGSLNGNTPQLYVAAWRHVTMIFRAAGATNVQWVWAPNNGPTSTIASYYPGDDYVDVIGLDGYNWGSGLAQWQTFTQAFGPSYAIVTALSSTKPIEITETASAEAGGSKASWITSAFLTEIPASFPRVVAVIWFDVNKETDWRIDSSPTALSAYQQVAGSPLWGGQSTATATTGANSSTTTSTTPAASATPTTSTTTDTTTSATTVSLATPFLSVSSYGRSSASFSWASVPGATGYTVEAATDSSFSAPVDVDVSGTSATVSRLQSATSYWFRLRATVGSVGSAWSPSAPLTTTGKPHK
jgi:hypothetical protein